MDLFDLWLIVAPLFVVLVVIAVPVLLILILKRLTRIERMLASRDSSSH